MTTPSPKPASEHISLSDAYEWGDPKNPEYIEWLIETADAERG